MFGSAASTMDDAEEHVFGSQPRLLGQQPLDDVQKALRKEVAIFERRERMLAAFKVIVLCVSIKLYCIIVVEIITIRCITA